MISKGELRNLINFELKHNFGKDYVSKKEIRKTLNIIYEKGFIVINNKNKSPVMINCSPYFVLDLLNGYNNWEGILYEEYGEIPKDGDTIIYLNEQEPIYETLQGHGHYYSDPGGAYVEGKIEGKIKEVIISAISYI